MIVTSFSGRNQITVGCKDDDDDGEEEQEERGEEHEAEEGEEWQDTEEDDVNVEEECVSETIMDEAVGAGRMATVRSSDGLTQDTGQSNTERTPK